MSDLTGGEPSGDIGGPWLAFWRSAGHGSGQGEKAVNWHGTPIRGSVSAPIDNDPDLREIVILSLEVSVTASLCALVIGGPLGTALAVYRFAGEAR
jgi:hypothetical protein